MPRDNLKTRALRYYRTKAELYDERYHVQAAGDILWQRHNGIIQMINEIALPRGARILDLGCGPGVLSLALAKQGYSGVGLDAAPEMIRLCQVATTHENCLPSWHYAVADVEAIPLADSSFDLLICSGVIDYLSTDDGLLKEAARVLKTGGYFILAVTNKFGYTVSLSSIGYAINRIPGVVRLASLVRRVIIGGQHGIMNFDFVPRKHRPAAIRKSLNSFGFIIDVDRYLQFTFFPAPFCYLVSRLRRPIISDETMNQLDGTALRILGSYYLIRGKLDK